MVTPTMKIYVHARIIMRGGRHVNGWQAGFQPRGGVTCEDKQQAIEHMRKIARQYWPDAAIAIEEKKG